MLHLPTPEATDLERRVCTRRIGCYETSLNAEFAIGPRPYLTKIFETELAVRHLANERETNKIGTFCICFQQKRGCSYCSRWHDHVCLYWSSCCSHRCRFHCCSHCCSRRCCRHRRLQMVTSVLFCPHLRRAEQVNLGTAGFRGWDTSIRP